MFSDHTYEKATGTGFLSGSAAHHLFKVQPTAFTSLCVYSLAFLVSLQWLIS